MDLEISKIIAGIKNDYELSLRKEALLRHAFEQQKAKVMEMKDQSIQYNILKREADTNRELYKGLLQRMKEAGVSAGLTVSNIQVVDQAEVPASPYKPNRRLNLLLAAVIGLFLGVGLAFFFEYLDNTVKTPEDVEQMIRLPSFGMVPEISYEKRRRLEKETTLSGRVGDSPASEIDPFRSVSEHTDLYPSLLLREASEENCHHQSQSRGGKNDHRDQYRHCLIPDRGPGGHRRYRYEEAENPSHF